LIEIGVQPFTSKQARKSALVVAAVLAAITAWQVYRQHPGLAQGFGAATLVLLATAAISPAAMFFHKWWMTLASLLGYVNSRILLGILYYGVMTPTGLVARLTGYDPLERRGAPAKSYWRRREHTRQSRQGFERAY
jgi:hypothetical protein